MLQRRNCKKSATFVAKAENVKNKYSARWHRLEGPCKLTIYFVGLQGLFCWFRRVVQLVEHMFPEHAIAGSIPASPAYV